MASRTYTLNEIRSKYPKCSTDSLQCDVCRENHLINLLSSSSSTYLYEWCQVLSCTKCHYSWYVCTFCSYHRSLRKEQLRQHHFYHHCSKTKPSNSQDNVSTLMPQPMCLPSDSSTDSHVSFSPQPTVNNFHLTDLPSSIPMEKNILYNNFIESLFLKDTHDQSIDDFLMTENRNYFQYWYRKKKPLEYLMACSSFNTKDNLPNIRRSDAYLNLQIFEFIYSLSRTQQVQFSNIMSNIHPHMLSPEKWNHDFPLYNHTLSTNYQSFMLPTSYNELRRTYLRGKSSFLENIPKVKVKTIGKGKNLHTYVSISDCVEHFLLFGGFGIINMRNNSSGPTNNIFDSTRCLENCNRVLSDPKNIDMALILPVVLFSDDFDPSISLVKANKQSIWMYSLSFKSQRKTTAISHTYILSIGNKGSDHCPVLQKIEAEMEQVRNGSLGRMFHGALCKYVKPVVIPILRHGDQPERRSINMLKLGKETNHARWQYSIDYKNCMTKLPSCRICTEMIETYILSNFTGPFDIDSHECCQCSNWSFDAKHEFLHTPPCMDFPSDMIPPSGLLPPHRLEKKTLINAVKTCHESIVAGKWKATNGRRFLEYYCLKTSEITEIIEKANNCLNLRIAEEKECRNQHHNFILEDAKKYPDLYKIHPMSHIYSTSSDDLDSFPDAPMHLFSGFVKATMNLVMLFLKRKNRYIPFMKSLSHDKTMEYLSSMNLQWLKIIPFSSDKFASYGCGNYLSLNSVMKLLCTLLLEQDYNDDFTFPSIPQKNWTSTINRKWLSIRGLSTEGVAKDLRERVASHMKSDNEDSVQQIHLLTVQHVVRMMISVHNALNLLMATSVSTKHIEYTHCSILRALNDIHKVDKHLRANQKNPIWLVKYNLLCLLNCREDMKLFGPTRDRWEGNDEGERGIQLVKKEFTAFRQGYQTILHEKVNVTQSIQNIQYIDNMPSTRKDDEHTNPTSNNGNFQKYKNSIMFHSKLLRHLPLSVVSLSNQSSFGFQIGFVTKPNCFYPLDTIVFVDTIDYSHLFSIGKFSFSEHVVPRSFNESDILEYGVCIPYVAKKRAKTQKNLYFIVTKSGKELNPSKTFVFPYI